MRMVTGIGVVLLFLALGLPARGGAGLDAGLAAYDAGDYAGAARIWRKWAAAGDAEAMVALAGLYEQGLGVPRDPSRARELYRRAAALGDATAKRILGQR